MAASNSSVMPANGGGAGHSPLCRCRVLYIGSAVPTVTKDGLQGIQQPLRERYPTTESPETRGIDSWLSVWYNGLLLEYVEGEKRVESAFFPINTLHYCAAVRYVNMGGFAVEGGGERFIPLDSPFALPDSSAHPPIFAAIFRRTTGVKVLECHGFVCTNEKAANALVRCCFHAYADTMYLKLDEKLPAAGGLKALKEQSSRSVTPSSELNLSEQENGPALMENSAEWNERAIGQKTWQRRQQSGEYDASSISSSLVKKNGGGGRGPLMNGAGRQQHHQEQMLVPYGGPADNSFSRRAASHSELRSSGADFFESPRRPPGPGPMFFDPRFGLMPPPAGMPPPFFPGPPPPHFMRPPPHFFPPPPPPHFPLHPAHFHRAAPPPNFGRVSQFPPYMMRPFFMMPPPPPFLGPHRPKSPDRGSGPIITDVYDTFPRQNRATYEEPIYMPSSNNPQRNSYKPGTEMYEHYYETYRQQRAPAEQKQQQHQQQNMSRSNSDASVDYWNNNNGFEPNAGRRAQNANERAFGHTLADEGGKKSAGNATPKANRSPLGTGKRNGHGVNNDKVGRADGQGTSRDAAPRPETPPADYEIGSEARGRRMAAY